MKRGVCKRSGYILGRAIDDRSKEGDISTIYIGYVLSLTAQ